MAVTRPLAQWAAALFAEFLSRADDSPGLSDSRPALDFLLFAQQLFNFELERYRAASVPFVDRLFLFHVSLDERILDFCYPGSLFHSEIWVCLHCRSPRNRSDDRAFPPKQRRGLEGGCSLLQFCKGRLRRFNADKARFCCCCSAMISSLVISCRLADDVVRA